MQTYCRSPSLELILFWARVSEQLAHTRIFECFQSNGTVLFRTLFVSILLHLDGICSKKAAVTLTHWPLRDTVYPKKYAHGFCFAVLCCGYTLTDFPISIRFTSLALWQFNDCPSASKATLMNMNKYFMGIHYERLHNHNKAKHNKTVCIFLGIYCTGVMGIKGMSGIDILRIAYEIAVMWMPQDRADDKSALFQAMAWCRQATSNWDYVNPELCRHMTSLGPNVAEVECGQIP